MADSLANFGCDSQSDHWFSSTADLPQQIKLYFPRWAYWISDWFGFVNFHFISSNLFGCLVALCEQVYVLRFSWGVCDVPPLTPRRGQMEYWTKMLGTEHIPLYLVGLRNDVGKWFLNRVIHLAAQFPLRSVYRPGCCPEDQTWLLKGTSLVYCLPFISRR